MFTTSMREYFRETLESSLKVRRTQLSETAQVYVVNLLTEFARSEQAFAGTDSGDRPFVVEMMARAQDSEPNEAVRIYKHLGDRTLYLSGFFPSSVDNGAASFDYYVAMGGNAYDAVARLVRPTAAVSSALFAELADRFGELVDLLCAMSLHGDKSRKLADREVLQLVDRYRRATQASEQREVLDALKAQGLVVRPGLDTNANAVPDDAPHSDDDDLIH